MKTKQTVKALVLLTAMGCGRYEQAKKAQPASPGSPTESGKNSDDDTSLLMGDVQLAGDHVASTVDDAIGDMVDGSESMTQGDSGFGLLDGGKSKEVTRFRECKVDQNKAVVTIKRSIEHERTIAKGGRTGSTVMKNLLEKTRTWARDGGAVACALNGKNAEISRAEMQGLSLDSTYRKSHLQSSSLTMTKKGKTMSRSRKTVAEGKRSVKWASVQNGNGTLVLTKTVQTESSRTVESTDKNGTLKSLSSSVKTDPQAPLVITTERESATDKLLSRTIVSGKKIATHKSGGRMETTFQNVRYLPTDGCYPTSGTIQGAFFPKDASEPTATFKIDYSADSPSIVMTKSDGTVLESEYVADGCDIEGQDLEETSGASSDKASAAEVTLAI